MRWRDAPAHITAWALIYAAEWRDGIICAREENTHSFSDEIQLRSAALSQPIWLHLQSSWSRAHADVPLGCLHFYRSAADLRPSQPRVAGRQRTPLTGRDGGTGLWWQKRRENGGNQKECMTWCLGKALGGPSFHLCIFIAGASRASYARWCQVLVYTAAMASPWTCGSKTYFPASTEFSNI